MDDPTFDEPLAPLWCRTAPPLAAEAVVRVGANGTLDDTACDAIVVGAGVTGLSTALHLAEAGARVVVLERLEPGHGSTGRANGQVIAGLQQPPERIRAAYGDARGERVVGFAGAAPDMLFELVRRHGIACDARRNGWIQATRSAREVPELAAIAGDWAARGAPARALGREDVAALLGTRAYAGGWVDARGGTIQPLAYVRGLALAAARAGVRIACGVNVDGLARRDGAWHAATNRGGLSAKAVVLATNVYTAKLCGFAGRSLGRAYLGAYSLQLASAPLDAARRAEILPQGHACGDTSHVRLRYFRLDADGRFVIGGPGWLRAPRSGSSFGFRILERSARRMFPALAGVAFEERWAARDTLTADLLPHLYEPGPGLYAALGYNGRGLAIGTALGAVLARRVGGEPEDASPFPTTDTSRVPLALRDALRLHVHRLLRH